MAKNTNRVASAIAYVAALGLATGAWAAHWEMFVDNPVTYAKEVFGGDNPGVGGVTLKVDDVDTTDVDEGTSVLLRIALPNDGSADSDGVNRVAGGAEVEVTLTLDGGKFGQAVNWTDIAVVQPDGTTDLDKVGGSQEGGRRGTDSVSVKLLLATEGSITVDPAPGSDHPDFMKAPILTEYGVRFDLGSIQDYTGAGTVTASASFRVTDGPAQNFPTETAPRMAVAMIPAGPGPDGEPGGGDDTEAVPAVRGTSNVIANTMAAQTFMATPGASMGQIDIDDRTSFDGTTTKVEVASFSYTNMAEAVEADGKTSFATGKGMQANIMVTVTGMVRDGDVIYFNQDGDTMMGDREQLTVSGGTATRTFRITNIDDPTGTSVYFTPNGDDAMSAGNVKAEFSVEYDDSAAVTPMPASAGVDFVYAGINMEALAYAIPNAGMDDIGNVRIKCEADSEDAECTVFLDCDEQDGTSHFEELGETIGAGKTMVLQSSAIADLLGGPWEGRLSCEIFSDNSVSSQVLVRSGTGHALINNTYVSGADH